ncbi:MAG: alpha-ribazole phosphatase [Pelotomaculum sp.]|uniref:Alpha-ribazole phosphatase n=1 Tax=Pelotomaculum thermopropionicum (strain DSM 13744 / JCM 10971 / SI) TaxID=370438 RepID=A5D4H2_PELTS|nr:alpha-ribazole phosphatase [Pelotomaculum sp.]BAF58870.1 fructose-2,6-bisphosphatase [Pelotomaculum thermopropionicum SI]
MKPRRIYLVRHGEVAGGGSRRFIGQIDLPLSEAGRKQAACLRDALARAELNGIFCSDLDRSVTTALIIGEKHNLKPVPKKELREISLGAWEGLTFEEVRRKYPGEFEKRGACIVHYRPPWGESFARCAARVIPALKEIVSSVEGNILIVGHAGVNRIILCLALGAPLENLFRIKQDYGCLNVLLLDNSGIKIIMLNRTFTPEI